eukprot:g1837.t1
MKSGEEDVVEESCITTPFDFVTGEELSFAFEDGGGALALECALELSPIDGLQLVDDVDGTGDLTGARVWPGAELLLRYIASRPDLTRGRIVVELGAGAGSCGLAAARLAGDCAACVLTDGSEPCVELCQRNIHRNVHECVPNVSAERLRWGAADAARLRERLLLDQAGAVSLVLASEVIYDAGQLQPFFAAARALLVAPVQPGVGAVVCSPACGRAGTLVLSLVPRCDYSSIVDDVRAAARAAGFVPQEHIAGASSFSAFMGSDPQGLQSAADAVAKSAAILIFVVPTPERAGAQCECGEELLKGAC